jgi:hypothetical protein
LFHEQEIGWPVAVSNCAGKLFAAIDEGGGIYALLRPGNNKDTSEDAPAFDI